MTGQTKKLISNTAYVAILGVMADIQSLIQGFSVQSHWEAPRLPFIFLRSVK